MIRKIEFENFMSLKNTSVDLDPLTVFIGPNASGKSAIFKGLVTLSRLLNGAPVRGKEGAFYLESGVTLDDFVWGGNPSLPIKFRVWFWDDADEPGYVLELRKLLAGWSVIKEKIRCGSGWIEVDENHPFEHPTERGNSWVHTPPLRATLRYLVNPFLNDSAARPVIEPIVQLAERFGQAWRYRPSASDIAAFVPHPTQAGRSIFVRENGSGVAAELQALQGSKREVFEKIEEAICEMFPHIRAIGFETASQGVRLKFFTTRSGNLLPAPQESDGVLLATFLFWRLCTGTGTSSLKVCLEEPENGLHPFLLGQRFQVLKKFAYPAEGQPGLQILVATHSPELLRVLHTHHGTLFNQTRLVEFAPANGTSVRGLADYREAHNLYEEYLTHMQKEWGTTDGA